MKNLYRFLLIILLSVGTLHAQKPLLVTCTSQNNPDNSISIFAESTVFGEYTLKLSFPNLTGYKANNIYNDVAVSTITMGKKEVVKLVPDKQAMRYSFNYRWTYYPGVALSRPPADSSFIYLLPGTPDNVLRISKTGSIEDRLNRKPSSAFYGTGFIYNSGDTICAARAGIVYECSDEIKEAEKGTEVFRAERNRINIQQKDGSLAHYVSRAPIQLLVAGGDHVLPGQPIAVFSKSVEKPEMLFTVNYLDEKKMMTEAPDLNNPTQYIYLPAKFCTGEEDKTGSLLTVINQTFKVVHPKEIAGAELSKKDKKKLGIQ